MTFRSGRVCGGKGYGILPYESGVHNFNVSLLLILGDEQLLAIRREEVKVAAVDVPIDICGVDLSTRVAWKCS